MRDKPQAGSSGGWWIRLGALLMLAAALLVGKNLHEQSAAAGRSRELLEQAERQMATAARQDPEGGESTPDSDPASLWDGYDIAGILSLPDLGLELPVLADYSDDLLKVSICVFDETGTPEDGSLILAGHNYRAYFGRLSQLSVGAEVRYRPTAGEEILYHVAELTEIDADDGDALMEGSWDLTLVTCNLDMSKRILARCTRSEP